MQSIAVATSSTTCRHALLAAGLELREQGYRFVCPTPETQAIVLSSDPQREARTLRDVFGWNLPFAPALLSDRLLALLHAASAVEAIDDTDGLLRSRVRYSSLGERLFVHSGFPTTARNSVFLGPDTQRFVAFVQGQLAAHWPHRVRRVVDIGCGTGAGAILAADSLDLRALERIVLRDLNPVALQFAAINVALNETPYAHSSLGSALEDVEERFDLILANPPYLIDPQARSYCDGGSHWGLEISLRFLDDAIEHLAPGGRLMFYTGTPVVQGQDLFFLAALPLLAAAQLRHRYVEIDPDVFGDALREPPYRQVERIAAVGLCAYKPGAVF